MQMQMHRHYDARGLLGCYLVLLRRRCTSYPRMLVVNPRRPPALWFVPRSLLRNPSWLEQLQRVLLSPTLPATTRGDGVLEVTTHQALFH